MKKQIALFLCIALLAGCTAKQADTQEAAASAQTESSRAESAAEPQVPASSAVPEVSVPAIENFSAPEEAPAQEASGDAIPAAPVRVPGELTVFYGAAPRFSMKLAVPADAAYSGGADAVRVERKTETGWETVRDDGAGNFTLEGKLTVNGPLPADINEQALEGGVLYRVTTTLQTDAGGAVTASAVFRAGESFADDAPRNLADAGSFQMETHVDTSGDGPASFTQTVTNCSGQTVSVSRRYKMLQSGGGLWKEAVWPEGMEPAAADGLLYLKPGESVSLDGILPVAAKDAAGESFRIEREASVISPRPGQEKSVSFFTQLEGGTFREGAPALAADSLRDVALSLGQTSFLAGEAPVTAYLQNKSGEPIVVSRLRVYNVKDGENLLVESGEARLEISAGESRQVLNVTLALEQGEYTVEASVVPRDGGAEAPFSRNFTVKADKLENAASAATVAMKVEVDGQTGDGLAMFTQTLTNNSCQTLLAGREFRVEQQAGGLWARAEYPEGREPAFPEDMVILRPGESVSLEGVLPFPLRDPPAYRITRTLVVENPTPVQENGLTLVYTVTKK